MKLCSFQLEYVSMVPTLEELKEPNIVRLWRREEDTAVSHGPVPKTTGGDK